MSRLGVISDGISRDLEHALRVARDAGLDEIELQFVWDREVGDLDADETERVAAAVHAAKMPVSCVSRHIFGGVLVRETEPGGEEHRAQLGKLASCIDLAHRLDCDVVRIMSGRREMILFGENGADQWNVAHGAWEGLKALVVPAVEMAEREGVTLVVETGNGGTICSARSCNAACLGPGQLSDRDRGPGRAACTSRTWWRTCRPPTCGCASAPAIRAVTGSRGYTGAISLDVYRPDGGRGTVRDLRVARAGRRAGGHSRQLQCPESMRRPAWERRERCRGAGRKDIPLHTWERIGRPFTPRCSRSHSPPHRDSPAPRSAA